MIAGSIIVETAIHVASCDIEQFLNFPRNSFALARLCFSWALPFPSGASITPSVLQLEFGAARSSEWDECVTGFRMVIGAGNSNLSQEILFLF